MACQACEQNNKFTQADFSDKVNLFKFNSNREQIKDPSLPDSLVLPASAIQATILEQSTTQASTKDLPSIKKMAFSLTEALKDNIKQAVTGGAVLADPAVLLKRMDLCAACDYFVADQSRCAKCGCFMNIKARMQVSKCPLGKW